MRACYEINVHYEIAVYQTLTLPMPVARGVVGPHYCWLALGYYINHPLLYEKLPLPSQFVTVVHFILALFATYFYILISVVTRI